LDRPQIDNLQVEFLVLVIVTVQLLPIIVSTLQIRAPTSH
jgi:hypothetical protein